MHAVRLSMRTTRIRLNGADGAALLAKFYAFGSRRGTARTVQDVLAAGCRNQRCAIIGILLFAATIALSCF
jgi:hypothetical protein